MFKTISPEQAGIPSAKVLEFLKVLDAYRLNTHSVIMARGDHIFAEAYYAPINAQSNHRMYSVSKSFISIAVGLAEQEGLLSLDDPFMKYFSEYRNENVDGRYEETTIRDLLTMRSCIADKAPDWWEKEDRVKEYFSMTSNQIPGTNFSYDSAGSMLLGTIVEKLTGMPFLEYLKERFLLEMGFSKDSYCLLAPGGHSHSDSGVMCTSRDLLTFARFVMNGGVWNGKRFVNEAYMRAAVSRQTDNNMTGMLTPFADQGYGYLIWKMPRDGFAFVGMADQYAICDPKTDFICVITSANFEPNEAPRIVIFHELYKTIIGNLGVSLPENEREYGLLAEYMSSRTLSALTGGVHSSFAPRINGKTYRLESNVMKIDTLRVTIKDDCGTLEYTDEEGLHTVAFGMGHNVFGAFPGKKRMSLTASVYEEGTYQCGASAIWCEDAKLHIMVHIIDTYLGTLSVVLGFKDNRVSVAMKGYAQRILLGKSGRAMGTWLETEPDQIK